MASVLEIGRVMENGTPKIVAREIDEHGNHVKVILRFTVQDDTIGASYCRISINDDHTLRVELLNKAGRLWINQREYIRKARVTKDDVIYLGEKKLKLEVSKLIGAWVGYDISHLELVWTKYKSEQEKLRKSDALKKRLGSIPTYILLALATATGAAGQDLGVWRWVIMILFLIGTALYEFFKSDTLAAKLDSLKDKLVDDYVCPSCGTYLGEGRTWHMLSSSDACPFCQSKFYVDKK